MRVKPLLFFVPSSLYAPSRCLGVQPAGIGRARCRGQYKSMRYGGAGGRGFLHEFGLFQVASAKALKGVVIAEHAGAEVGIGRSPPEAAEMM